jgi:uncharacterized membrane protein
MKQNDHEVQNKSKELLRLETFSDGVFAIAITLLILEVIQTLHGGEHQRLPQLLLSHWNSLLVFLVGFLTILVCWINHHLVLTCAARTDSKFFWVNGFVLLVVTFTPFPTAVAAAYLESESHNAMAFFGFNYFMMSVAAYCMTSYVHGKLALKEKSELLSSYKLLYGCSIGYTLLAFFVCFVSVALAIGLYVILFFAFAFPGEFAARLMKRRQAKKKRAAKAQQGN